MARIIADVLMKLGLRASKSEENEKKRQEAIKTEAELRLEQKISEYECKNSKFNKEKCELEKIEKREKKVIMEGILIIIIINIIITTIIIIIIIIIIIRGEERFQ